MTTLETGLHYPLQLDRLPEGWEVGYVGDFAIDIEPGFASGEHNREGSGVPHLRPMNIDRSGKIDLNVVKYVDPAKNVRRLRCGDVLFNNTNSPELIGKTTAITKQMDWAFSNHMTRIAFSERVDSKFAAYQLHFLWMTGYFLHKCVKHVNQASVSSTTLARTVPFVRPPLDQQKATVAEIEKQFSRLDEAVANLKRVKANLKRYKAAVLKAAVEGKLTEEWRKRHPDIEPANELLKRILAERQVKWNGRSKYKEPTPPDTVDLPSLPDNWTWVRWEQIGFSQNGRAFPSKEYQAQGVKLLRPGNLHVSGKVVWNEGNSRYLPKRWATEFPEFIVGPRELIMNLTAQSLKDEFLGRVCLTGPDERCLLNQRLARLSPIKVLPEFLLWLFKSSVFRRFVDELNTGSLIQHMFTTQLGDFLLPLPPLPEQTQLVAEVERRLSVIEELEAMTFVNFQRAERLKQSVLQRVFAGRFQFRTWQ